MRHSCNCTRTCAVCEFGCGALSTGREWDRINATQDVFRRRLFTPKNPPSPLPLPPRQSFHQRQRRTREREKRARAPLSLPFLCSPGLSTSFASLSSSVVWQEEACVCAHGVRSMRGRGRSWEDERERRGVKVRGFYDSPRRATATAQRPRNFGGRASASERRLLLSRWSEKRSPLHAE